MYESKNVLGETLQVCNSRPLTGFYRDGCCNTSKEDVGLHTVCTQVTISRVFGILQGQRQ